MSANTLRTINDWNRIERVTAMYRIGEEPPEAWFWRDIRIEDRIEAVERMRRGQHGWEQGYEPAFERTACIVEFE